MAIESIRLHFGTDQADKYAMHPDNARRLAENIIRALDDPPQGVTSINYALSTIEVEW